MANTPSLFGDFEGGVASVLSENGIIITRKSDNAIKSLRASGFDILDLQNQVVLAVRPVRKTVLQGRNAFIVVSENPEISIQKNIC